MGQSMSNEVEQRLFLLLESIEQKKEQLEQLENAVKVVVAEQAKTVIEIQKNVATINAESMAQPLIDAIKENFSFQAQAMISPWAHIVSRDVERMQNSVASFERNAKAVSQQYKTALDIAKRDTTDFVDSTKKELENVAFSWKYLGIPLGSALMSILAILVFWMATPSAEKIENARNEYNSYVERTANLKSAEIKHNTNSNLTYIRIDPRTCVSLDKSSTNKNFCAVD